MSFELRRVGLAGEPPLALTDRAELAAHNLYRDVSGAPFNDRRSIAREHPPERGGGDLPVSAVLVVELQRLAG